MVFTKEDARDDAKIKSEVRGDLLRVAKNQSPQIFEHFERVCHELDQDPGDVLADMLVRAINSQEYADKVSAQKVSMEVIQTGEFRKDDIELVKSLADEFDLTPDEEEDNVVDRIIEKRIESVSTSPLEGLAQEDGGQRGGPDREVEQLEREVSRLQNELQRVKNQDSGGGVEEVDNETSSSGTSRESKKDLDDLFDDGGSEDEETDEGESQEDDGETSSFSVDVTDVSENDEEETHETNSAAPDIDIDKSASEEDEMEDAFDE